jgi:hypothetical protein
MTDKIWYNYTDHNNLPTSVILDDTGIILPASPAVPHSPARVDQLFDEVFGVIGGKRNGVKSLSESAESVPLCLPSDPLAVVLHLKKTGNFPHEWDLLNCEPLAADQQLAAEIRSYYIDKILMQKMSGTYTDTQYKRELQRALRLSEQKQVLLGHVPILYRLDDFYQEDQTLERVVKSARPSDLDRFQDNRLHAEPLTYLARTRVYRRGGATNRIFFTDSAQELVCISYALDNPLRGFLELTLGSRPPLSVTGKFSVHKLFDQDFQYISVVPEQVTVLADQRSA